jgi:Kdo2-lipid IVA lauroyltransferase/acyltransferase
MEALFKLLARCPLTLLHSVGAALGWLAYAFSRTYRRRFKANSQLASYSAAQVRGAIGHAGRMVAELPRLWLGKPVPIRWTGEDVFEAVHANGRGIIFLTPHLGCFEITAQAIAQRYSNQSKQINVLYRPARQAWLHAIMKKSRDRPGMHAIPATLSGVKALVRALHRGEALGMLPDQVPPQGLGVWAEFFNQPAYTMTLPAKLAQQTGAQLVLVWGERLPLGQGFAVHFSRFQEELSSDLPMASQQINCAMENLVRECPQQYLWGYARYKKPRSDTLGTSASMAGSST